MTILASQITSLTVVYSIVYSGVNQRKHQSSASLAFVREIHRGPVNFPHKWPVTRKMFPFDDVIMQMHFFCILIKISLKFVPKGTIGNNPTLVSIMAWRRIGDKSLSEPMLTRFPDAYMALGGDDFWYQQRRSYSVLAMELSLLCFKPSICRTLTICCRATRNIRSWWVSLTVILWFMGPSTTQLTCCIHACLNYWNIYHMTEYWCDNSSYGNDINSCGLLY